MCVVVGVSVRSKADTTTAYTGVSRVYRTAHLLLVLGEQRVTTADPLGTSAPQCGATSAIATTVAVATTTATIPPVVDGVEVAEAEGFTDGNGIVGLRQQLACHHEMLLQPSTEVIVYEDEFSNTTAPSGYMTVCNQMITAKGHVHSDARYPLETCTATLVAEPGTAPSADDIVPRSQCPAAETTDGDVRTTSVEAVTADAGQVVNRTSACSSSSSSTERFPSRSGAVQEGDSEMESGIETDSEDETTAGGRQSAIKRDYVIGNGTSSSTSHHWSTVVNSGDSTCRIRHQQHRTSAAELVAALYDPCLSIDEFIAKAMVHPPPTDSASASSPSSTGWNLSNGEKELAKFEELFRNSTPPSPSLSSSSVIPRFSSPAATPVAEQTFQFSPPASRQSLDSTSGVVRDANRDSLRSSLLDVTLEDKYAQLVIPPPPTMTSPDQIDVDKILSLLVACRGLGDVGGDGGVVDGGRRDNDEASFNSTLTSSKSSSRSAPFRTNVASPLSSLDALLNASLLPPLPPSANEKRPAKLDASVTAITTARSENGPSSAVIQSAVDGDNTTTAVVANRPPLLSRQLSLPVSSTGNVDLQTIGVRSRRIISTEYPSSSDSRFLAALQSPPSVRQRRFGAFGSARPTTPPKPVHVEGVGILSRTRVASATTASAKALDAASHAARRPLHPPPSPPPRTSSVQNSPVASACGRPIAQGRGRTTPVPTASRDEGLTVSRDEGLSTPSPPPSPAPLPPPPHVVVAMSDFVVVVGSQTPTRRRGSTESSASDAPSMASSRTAGIRPNALRCPPSMHIKTTNAAADVATASPKTSSLPRGITVDAADGDAPVMTFIQPSQVRSQSLTDGGQCRHVHESRSVFGALRSKLRSYWSKTRKSSSASVSDCDGPSSDYRSSFRSTDGSGRRCGNAADHDFRRKSPSPSLLPVSSYRKFAADDMDAGDELVNVCDGDGDDITLSAEENFLNWSPSADAGSICCSDIAAPTRGVRSNGSLKSFTGSG